MPCDRPHTTEAYAHWDLEGEWTTLEEVTALSEAGCADRFEACVGTRYRRSELDVLYFAPVNEASFRRDRGVVCMVVAPASVSGSLQGSRR